MPTDLLPLIGYFTSPDQTEPAFDPPHDSPCLVCDKPLLPDDVRTISIMLAEGADERSFFYRIHRTCGDLMSRDEGDKLSSRVFEALAR